MPPDTNTVKYCSATLNDFATKVNTTSGLCRLVSRSYNLNLFSPVWFTYSNVPQRQWFYLEILCIVSLRREIKRALLLSFAFFYYAPYPSDVNAQTLTGMLNKRRFMWAVLKLLPCIQGCRKWLQSHSGQTVRYLRSVQCYFSQPTVSTNSAR